MLHSFPTNESSHQYSECLTIANKHGLAPTTVLFMVIFLTFFSLSSMNNWLWSVFLLFSGNSLLKVGQTEQKLGDCEKTFILTATTEYMQPLKVFLDTDMKTITVSRSSPLSYKSNLYLVFKHYAKPTGS